MKRVTAKIILALAAVFSLVSGCQCSRINPDKPRQYDKVLILYSAGYNSLRNYLYEDIQDLKNGYAPGIRDDEAFLVVSHLAVSRGDYSTATSPQLIRIYSDKKKGVILDTLKSYNGNLSEKSTMNTILSDIKKQFPTAHYGMVFSSHATGWMPVGYYNNPKDYEPSQSAGRKGSSAHALPDGAYPYLEPELLPGEPLTKSLTMTNSVSTAVEMELVDFKDAIPMHLDYILMDACLCGGIEVAYELKDVCDQIGFSQAEILADGFNYKNLAGHLLGPRERTPEPWSTTITSSTRPRPTGTTARPPYPLLTAPSWTPWRPSARPSSPIMVQASTVLILPPYRGITVTKTTGSMTLRISWSRPVPALLSSGPSREL